MSLRPRFSNDSNPGRNRTASSGDTTATSQQQHNTVKDHRRRLNFTPRYYHHLFIIFLILLVSFYFFDVVFIKLNPGQDDSAASSIVRHTRVLRGLLGVDHVNQRTTPSRSSPTTTRQEHPRMVRYNLLDGTAAVASSSSFRNTSLHGVEEAMEVVVVEPMSLTVLVQTKNHERENKKKLGLADPLETRTCQAQYQWQLDSKITCNSMHEIDLGHFLDMKNNNKHGGDYSDSSDNNVLRERVRLIAGGGWRDVWGLLDPGDINDNNAAADSDNDSSSSIGYVVLKTLLYNKDVVPRNVERHRRDAMVMERLTSSPNIVDIYSFCGNSGIFEFANGGDLGNAVQTLDKSLRSSSNGQLTREERLQRLHFGVQAAMGLADLHNFDKEGRPSVAHTDISLYQFVKIDDHFKLNDFNRARFLMENRKTKEVCPYRVGGNPGRSRSPEEYMHTDQTEKVDVYSFGNILYTLLTLERLFYNITEEAAQDLVIEGKRPSPIGNTAMQLWTSNDPIDVALKSAMDMCLIYNVTERATARQVEIFLKAQLELIDPGRLEAWGVK